MGPRGRETLVAALRDHETMFHLDAEAWNALLPAARRHGLMARLGMEVEALGACDRVPDAPRRQFAHAMIAARSSQTSQSFEIDRVQRALAGLDTKIVLLKGGAYLHAGLPPAKGRSSVDLDILVPRVDIPRVEQALVAAGWEQHAETEYDEHYYRDWMHEIPPMMHPEREYELDVHHTIFPPVAGIRIDAGALLAAAVPLEGDVWMLCPTDMVLHGAVHLFCEDPTGKLRDLVDLHDLLTHFGKDEAFWARLTERARLHGLQTPLAYALRYTARYMGTAVPRHVTRGSGAMRSAAMDWLIGNALTFPASGTPNIAQQIAQRTLYIRSHWLKMPTGMLIKHLWVKWKRRREEIPA